MKNILIKLFWIFCGFVLCLFLQFAFAVEVIYVKGKYGKYCYIEGKSHGNIKYFKRFGSLEDCEKFIKK
jgi:hypothetical protein